MPLVPTPTVNVFVTRHGPGFRIYFHPKSWCPPMLRDHLDEYREKLVTREPILDDLDRHMWATDAPYEKRVGTLGGFEVVARGRSAVCLVVWLEQLLIDETTSDSKAARV